MGKEEFIENVRFIGEDWKFVPGTAEDYAVSSLGRVISFKAKSPKLLVIVVQESRGRKYSHVCINSKKVRVHRLVAEAFVNNPNGYNEIDHINNDPQDNRARNLKWVSHSENMNNPFTKEKQRQYIPNGKNMGTAVFFNRHEDTMKAVAQIKNGTVVAEYKSLGEAERNGYKKTSVSAAINGRLKTYRGCVWKLIPKQ